MNENGLTQEEIDALLRRDNIDEFLTDMELDALGEIANITMGTAATALSNLINRKVEITTPQVSITNQSELSDDYPLPYVIVNVQYTEGLTGDNILIIKIEDAGLIVDLMMGGDGSETPQELSEMHLSAIGEAMNQMMGSGATAMSTIFQKKVGISPPSVRIVNLAEDKLHESADDVQLVKIVFNLSIEGIIDSEIMQIMPVDFAKQTSKYLLTGIEDNKQQQSEQSPVISAEEEVSDNNQTAEMNNNMPGIAVQQVQFAPLTENAAPKKTGNMSLILDVPLQFSVELGRTQKTIKDILELGPGAVVELDKLAGETVDIFVNGKFIAKGEVVVIDENYGVRITEILSSKERINNLR
ncbi:MAG: flagellar motor switch phosphatase FliY [Syntrophaceticus sp.]